MEDISIMRHIKMAVNVALVAVVTVMSISAVFAQTSTPSPTPPTTASPTVVMPKEGPATGRGL